MDIKKHEVNFHDGILVDIEQKQNNIIITMISSVISSKNITEKDFELSYDRTLRGKFHLINVHSIQVNNQNQDSLIMLYDNADIFDITIEKNKMSLNIIWQTLRPLVRDEKSEIIKIEADEIYWENIPNLVDPFWFKEPNFPEYSSRQHYHHLNHDAKKKRELFFDSNGKVVGKGTLSSQLKPKNMNQVISTNHEGIYPDLPISKYAVEFHDGDLIDIIERNSDIILFLISSEISESNKIHDLVLSKDHRLKGKLILKDVKKIIRNRKIYSDGLKMISPWADIFYLKFLSEHTIKLYIQWEIDSNLHKIKNDIYEIEASNISWESTPNLVDPNW